MSTSRHHLGSYDEALAEIREGAGAGLQAIDPLEHEAIVILELGAHVTHLEKRAAKRLAEGETFSESKS